MEVEDPQAGEVTRLGEVKNPPLPAIFQPR